MTLSVPEKVKVALALAVELAGCELMTVFGAIVSTPTPLRLTLSGEVAALE